MAKFIQMTLTLFPRSLLIIKSIKLEIVDLLLKKLRWRKDINIILTEFQKLIFYNSFHYFTHYRSYTNR